MTHQQTPYREIPLHEIIEVVRERLAEDWRKILDEAPTVHLAILREPYLNWILEGKKTIESRFSVKRCLPFGRVDKYHVVVLKRSGGPIVGLFSVKQVCELWCLTMPTDWDLFQQWSDEICADSRFWDAQKDKAFGTLIWIDQLLEIEPLQLAKRPGDRRAWIILRTDGILGRCFPQEQRGV